MNPLSLPVLRSRKMNTERFRLIFTTKFGSLLELVYQRTRLKFRLCLGPPTVTCIRALPWPSNCNLHADMYRAPFPLRRRISYIHTLLYLSLDFRVAYAASPANMDHHTGNYVTYSFRTLRN